MIKRNKLNHQLSKTSHGHVYLLDRSSIQYLIDLNSYQVSTHFDRAENTTTLSKEQSNDLNSYQPDYSLLTTVQEEKDGITQNEEAEEEKNDEKENSREDGTEFFKKELSRLNSTIEKLISQNERDKENFFGLIGTFQERVVMLENHIRLLKAPKKKKRWWKFWSS